MTMRTTLVMLPLAVLTDISQRIDVAVRRFDRGG